MYNKTTRKIISAKEVSIRKFNDGKCNLVYNGECIFDRFPKNLITKEDADLPFFDGTYIPENFCKGLAAKYLYSSEQKNNCFQVMVGDVLSISADILECQVIVIIECAC